MDETTTDLSRVASLIAEPARARILGALMGGLALTATELALHADVSSSTTSSHLAKLVDSKILKMVAQGRHRYFQLFDDDVASMLEGLIEFAARNGSTRRLPSDPALAAARICYDHLAGNWGVWLFDRLRERRFVNGRDALDLSDEGQRFFEAWSVDVESLRRSRRALCRSCLDWTERRFHLGGSLGAAILQRLFALRWARRERDSRAVIFAPSAEHSLQALFDTR